MAKSSNQKSKILYIMQFFLDETDEDNGITIKEIISKLDSHGIHAERKSIYDDIETLKTFGLDIISERSKDTKYFIGNRDFELPELKLLVDAVQCSKFITEKKSFELIRKLEKLTSSHQAAFLHRDVHIIDRIKRTNEDIYYNVDRLHTAIQNNKKITFRYFYYNSDLEKVYRKDGAEYTESPYGLCWSEENYYMVSYSEKYEGFTHYRVDRMSNIEVLEDVRKQLLAGEKFNVASYCKRMFNMFHGEEVRVHLRCVHELMSSMVDKFGQDILIVTSDESRSEIIVNVAVSTTFYGWLSQFGDRIEVVSPQDVRDGYLEHVLGIVGCYR